jgi:hypothetical protein
MAQYHITCQTCGKDFTVKNKWLVTTLNQRYCSHACRNRKNKLNEDYFSQINSDNLHTFGQVIGTSFIHDFQTIYIRSDQLTLQKIQSKIGSDYPIKNSELGKFQIKIQSIKMVNFLLSHGLSTNRYFQEFPPYDILTGLLDTDCYKEIDGVQTFRTPSSKLALEVCYLVGGEIITETYKDVPKGVLGCDWVVVW